MNSPRKTPKKSGARAPGKKNINAWLDEYTRGRIADGASKAGLTKTEFLRQAVLAYAKHITEETNA